MRIFFIRQISSLTLGSVDIQHGNNIRRLRFTANEATFSVESFLKQDNFKKIF